MNPDESKFILLRNHSLFRKLSNKECDELNIDSGMLKPSKNEFVYFSEYGNDRLYFLKKGYVKIGYYDADGKEVIQEILQQGDIFGQIGLGQENENEFAQVVKSNAVICSFKVADFEEILRKKPDLAISFTRLVGLKFKRLQNRLSNIVNKDVRQRLIDFLYQLAMSNNTNADNKGKLIIQNFMTHADVASLIGSTRQTVTTLLNQLQDERLVIFDRKEIVFTSIEALEKLSKTNG